MRNLYFILVVALIIQLAGCGTKHPVKIQIPASCMRVRITGFTEPCTQLKDGSLMCNKVHVEVNCVAAIK